MALFRGIEHRSPGQDGGSLPRLVGDDQRLFASLSRLLDDPFETPLILDVVVVHEQVQVGIASRIVAGWGNAIGH